MNTFFIVSESLGNIYCSNRSEPGSRMNFRRNLRFGMKKANLTLPYRQNSMNIGLNVFQRFDFNKFQRMKQTWFQHKNTSLISILIFQNIWQIKMSSFFYALPSINFNKSNKHDKLLYTIYFTIISTNFILYFQRYFDRI